MDHKTTMLQNGNAWAFFGPMAEEGDLAHLIKELRAMDFGYIHLLAKQQNEKRHFLLVPHMSAEQAISLGRQFQYPSVIVKDETDCREIDLRTDASVRSIPLSGGEYLTAADAGMLLGDDLQELWEVEAPRASYFGEKARLVRIL